MIRTMIPVSDMGTAMKGELAALQRQSSRSVETIRNEDGLPPSPQYRTEAAARQTERPSQATKLPPPQQTACRRAEPKSNTPAPGNIPLGGASQIDLKVHPTGLGREQNIAGNPHLQDTRSEKLILRRIPDLLSPVRAVDRRSLNPHPSHPR